MPDPSIPSRVLAQLMSRPVDRRLLHPPELEVPSPGGLTLTWLGTAGVALDAADRRLLIDPYLSRPSLGQTLLCPLVPDEDLLWRRLPRADGIICTHTHHDHLLDIPTVARTTGAWVLGSQSCLAYCRASGLPERQLRAIPDRGPLSMPPFTVTLRPSTHSLTPLHREPLPGTIPEAVVPPLRVYQFRNEATVAVEVAVDLGAGPPLRVLHLGSAGFLPETLRGPRCQVLMVALVGRRRVPGFTARLLANLQPEVVVPIHFDDFMAPLDRPLRQLAGADVEGFIDEVRRLSPATRTVVLDLFGRLHLDPKTP